MNLEELERNYQLANIGGGRPDYAIFRIPAFGIVVLIRGSVIEVNGREGTWVEWNLIRGWLAQRKCELFLKQQKYQAQETCEVCGGYGERHEPHALTGEPVPCDNCLGTGRVKKYQAPGAIAGEMLTTENHAHLHN